MNQALSTVAVLAMLLIALGFLCGTNLSGGWSDRRLADGSALRCPGDLRRGHHRGRRAAASQTLGV